MGLGDSFARAMTEPPRLELHELLLRASSSALVGHQATTNFQRELNGDDLIGEQLEETYFL